MLITTRVFMIAIESAFLMSHFDHRTLNAIPGNFLRIIRVHGVCRIVDARTIPCSRRNRQCHAEKKRSFGSSLMLASLEARDVVLRDGCRVCRGLGGLSVTRVVAICYGESSSVEARRG